jgi:hypothetical protein
MEPEYVTKADLEASELRLLERIEKTETTLLKEFRKWAVRFEAVVRVNEASVVGFNARLASLEERVDDLEGPHS